MKNYVELLSNDDMEYVCRAIGAKPLRDLYKKSSRAFNKIKPGFRPGRLSDEETYSLAVNNGKTGFIAHYLYSWIEDQINLVKGGYEKLISSGVSETEAIIVALAISEFNKRPELYYTLTETEPNEASKEAIFLAVRFAAERDSNLINHDGDKATPEDHVNEKELEDRYANELAEIQNKHNSELAEINKELSDGTEQIQRLSEENDRLQEEKNALQQELKKYRSLSKYAVKVDDYSPAENYQYSSLCTCYTDYNDQVRLRRIADVKNFGFSEVLLESAPNYKNLYWKDGPNTLGFIGVWDWYVTPNLKDPTKDYIDTTYNDRILPIEVCVFNECKSIKELILMLKEGIPFETHTQRITFAIRKGAQLEGVYCEEGQLEMHAGIVALSEEVAKLPVFVFSKSSVIEFEEASILDSPKLGVPDRLVRVKNPMELIKERIVSRASWSVAQQQGLKRGEYRQIKDFLNGLYTEDLFEEISTACDCSIEEAHKYVSDFTELIDSGISGSTLENSIAAQIIRNDPSKYEACKEEIKEEWTAQNSEMIYTAKEELEEIRSEVALCQSACDQKKQELENIERQIAQSETKRAAQEKLAEDVEMLVNERIDRARKNAAEFIAENAFINSDSFAERSPQPTNEAKPNGCHFFESVALSLDDPELYSKPEELLKNIEDELIEVGVKKTRASDVAAFMYSAYIERIPILLAGPSGREIAEAFSIAMNCRLPATLKCNGAFIEQAINDCKHSRDEVVLIEGLLKAEWQTAIIEMVSKRDKFYVATHPFAEDLVIEPKGLFNYFMPILTDDFVSGLPTDQYIGGKPSEGFNHFEAKKASSKFDSLLVEMRSGAISRINTGKMAANIHAMLGSKGVDVDYQLLLYPLAYALNELTTLAEYAEGSDAKPSEKMRKFLRRIIGEEK